jgi:hypothetical protein
MADIKDEPKHIESASWLAAIKRNEAATVNDADHWWLNGHYGNYRDWHNHPRNRRRNFSVVSFVEVGLIRETPDPETYQAFWTEKRAAFYALKLAYENALMTERDAKAKARRKARNMQAQQDKRDGLKPRRPRLSPAQKIQNRRRRKF